MSDGAQSKPTLADTSEEGERCIQGMRDDCSVGQTDDKHSHPPGMSATPPKFVTVDRLMRVANEAQNMSLAHEIVINRDFQLERHEPQQNSVQGQVRDVMQKAFWDALELKLAADPIDFSHAVVLIEEIREVLLSLLLPHHERLRGQILDVLDLDLIRQKMENGAFDIFYYASYVIGTMARMCAPERDDRIAALHDVKDVVPLFRAMFEVLDLMKMDMANFTIQQIRPYLQQQSVEYERHKFNELLNVMRESGTDGLECTRLWLERCVERLKSDGSAHSSRGQCTSGTDACCESSVSVDTDSPCRSRHSAVGVCTVTPAAVIDEAFLDTLSWGDDVLYPETLAMDKSRLCHVRDTCRLLTTVASVQMITYSTVGASISGVSSLKSTLKSHVQTLLEINHGHTCVKDVLANVAEQVRKDVNDCLEELGFNRLDELKAHSLQSQIRGLAEPSNSVSCLLWQRLLTFIREMMSCRGSQQTVRVPTGFTSLDGELSQAVTHFLRLTSHNRTVFGPHYSDILAHRTHVGE